MGDQLVPAGHVDAVHVRVAHRGSGRGEGDLVRTGLTRHLDDLLRGRTSHDRVVDDEDVLAANLGAHRVELLLDALLALRLPGHDERAAHVPVLIEALAVLDSELLSYLHRGGPRRIGDRHDHVDIAPRRVPRDGVGEPVAEPEASFIHRDAVHDGVRASEIHVLERTRNEPRILGALLRGHLPVDRDEDRFTRSDIPHDLVSAALEHQGLGRNHPLVAHHPLRPSPHHERTNAERIAKSEQAMPWDQRDRGVRAFDSLVHPLDRGEQLCRVEILPRHLLLQFVGEHVDQQFGVGCRVEVPSIDVEQLLGELAGVCQVAVVNEHDAVRGVDVEGLRFLFVRRRPLRRISHVPEPHRAGKRAHVTRAERLAHLPARLHHVESPALRRCDTRRILPAMLQ